MTSKIWAMTSHTYRHWVSETGEVADRTGATLRQYNTNGYRRVYLPGPGLLYVHRLVLTAFVGPAPASAPEANHKNGIKDDNRIENLEWTTRKGNQAHMVQTGLASSVFTEAEVRRVRGRTWAPGEKAAYCRDRGLSHGALYNVLTHRVWGHVP